MQMIHNFVGKVNSKVAAYREERVNFASSQFDQCNIDVGNFGGSSGSLSERCKVKRSVLLKQGTVEKPLITTWDAGWNVSNAVQGMFVLGLPYAILHGGYVGILLIILAALMSYYTGNILIQCLYELDEKGERIRVRSTYVDVAAACWGRLVGGYVINTAQLIELLMTCVLYVVVSGNLMANSFPHLPLTEAEWSVLAALFLFPCIYLRHLRAVSKLSMCCSIAQIVILSVTMFYCFSKIQNWAWEKLTFSVDPKEFPISIGVIVFSYTSQIFLPSLEYSMEKREEFTVMLWMSYIASCVSKAFFALVCFLTWVDQTKDVVTDNLPQGLRSAVNVMLVIKALLSYPLPYYLSLELIEQSFFTGATGGWGSLFGTKRNDYNNLSGGNITPIMETKFAEDNLTQVTSPPSDVSSPSENVSSTDMNVIKTNGVGEKKIIVLNLEENETNRGLPSCYASTGDIQLWALLLRGFLVLSTLIFAIFIPHFALLMGLTGSLTGTSLSFLFPCAFHLQLKWKELSWKDVVIDVSIFVAGLLCTITGIYFSIIGLYEAYNPSALAVNSSYPIVGDNGTYVGPAWFPDFPKINDDFIPEVISLDFVAYEPTTIISPTEYQIGFDNGELVSPTEN